MLVVAMFRPPRDRGLILYAPGTKQTNDAGGSRKPGCLTLSRCLRSAMDATPVDPLLRMLVLIVARGKPPPRCRTCNVGQSSIHPPYGTDKEHLIRSHAL